jgi:hypothetical protein
VLEAFLIPTAVVGFAVFKQRKRSYGIEGRFKVVTP